MDLGTRQACIKTLVCSGTFCISEQPDLSLPEIHKPALLLFKRKNSFVCMLFLLYDLPRETDGILSLQPSIDVFIDRDFTALLYIALDKAVWQAL